MKETVTFPMVFFAKRVFFIAVGMNAFAHDNAKKVAMIPLWNCRVHIKMSAKSPNNMCIPLKHEPIVHFAGADRNIGKLYLRRVGLDEAALWQNSLRSLQNKGERGNFQMNPFFHQSLSTNQQKVLSAESHRL